MRIGILTYHRSHNYGALLQAYALKTYLKNTGNDAEIIDYWPQYHAEMYELFPYHQFKKHSFLGKIKFVIYFIVKLNRVIKRRKAYFNFISKELSLSNNPVNEKEWQKGLNYDIVLYGSDQIWRKQKTRLFEGFNNVYFAAFHNIAKKHIAYAASMGEIHREETELKFLKDNLKNFDVISVREDNLRLLLDEIGFQAKLVLDPVFLLKKEDWETIINNKLKLPKKKYIFFYHLMYSDDAIRFVKRLQDQFRYEVIEIRGQVFPFCFGERYKQTASPSEFLSFIKHAEIVVSTSFHGVAFSLIFQKQFYALGMKNNSARVLSLLSKMNISGAYIEDEKSTDYLNNINYKEVSPLLINSIEESFEFLANSIFVENNNFRNNG